MQLSKSKAIVTALLLMFAITISLVALPSATAQATVTSYAYINAVPNPVGVNQEVLLHIGMTRPLQSAEMGWEGLSVSIKRPDGRTDTITDIRTDSTGGTGRNYRPDIPGNYTLVTHFPQQTTTATNIARGFAVGTVMLADDSEPLTLVVQEDPTPIYPAHALPTEYWTRPIDPQLREWYTISGNWLFWTPRNLFAPYNDDAPETSHILWTKPLTQGGLVGGALGDPALEALGQHSFEEGDAYEGKWGGRGGGPIIIAGKMYYEKYAAGDAYKETACVDLRTGEELWSRPLENQDGLDVVKAGATAFGPPAMFGQVMYWDTYDYHGVYDYLWVPVGTTYYAFDPTTGDWVYTLTNVPSGTRVLGPKGEILIYTFNMNGGYMTLWNSTNIPALYASNVIGSMGWGQWKAMGRTVGATDLHNVTFGGAPYNPSTLPTPYSGYQWNVSIAGRPGQRSVPGSVNAVLDDRIIGTSISTTQVISWGLSLKPGDEGRLLFNKTWNAPNEWVAGNVSVSFAAVSSQGADGVFTLWAAELTKHYGFSTNDGTFLWETEPQHYLNTWVGTVHYIAYGKLISAGVSGIVYAYDLETGDPAWVYHANDQYQEILWANDWWMRPVFITDGKIYLGHLEHSPIDPKPRGAPFVCLNMTNGDEIWRADGLFRLHYWGGGPALIGDSIIAVRDTYDNRIYAIGKGPSATTVTAGPKISVHGSSVLVEGMVTDISAGTEDHALTKRFPSGVPAVSDANMSDWMLYVYKQFERPADVVGVEVVISVLDPNGNCYEVARTTSDASGYFGCTFEPLVPGFYKIIATFEGSNAYYGSFAETSLLVEEAPAATPVPTPVPQAPLETYFAVSTIAIILTIILVGAVLFLLFRKR